MSHLRPLFLGLIVGIIVYLGVRFIPGAPVASPVVSPAPSPTSEVTPEVTKQVTQGDTGGDTKPVTRLSPPVSPAVTSIPANTRVIFNEIAWMGTTSSSNDEWLELYNTGSESVDLSGWQIRSDDGKPTIPLFGAIGAGRYYLIERTSDTTVGDIPADLVASFGTGLANTGEGLQLLDPSGKVQDRVDCAGGWYAGVNGTPATRAPMVRIDPLGPGNSRSNWATSQVPGGTPGVQNPQKP